MGICSSDQSKKRVSAANEIELDKKADMFWSDQVDGNPSSWAAIKAYFEMKDQDKNLASAILLSAGVSLQNSSFNGSCTFQAKNDEYIYNIPKHIIRHSRNKHLKTNSLTPPTPETLNFKVHFSTSDDADLDLNLPNDQLIIAIKQLVFQKTQISYPKQRLSLNGKELDDVTSLADSGVTQDSVILVNVRESLRLIV